MTERPGPPQADEPTPAESDVARALKQIGRPAASSELKQRSRDVFLTGEPGDRMSHDGERLGGRSAEKVLVPARYRPIPEWRRWLIPTAIAAAIGVLLFGRTPAKRWQISDVTNAHAVGLRGQVVPGQTVDPGPLSTGDSSEVQIDLGETLRIRFVPGTRAHLPSPPGRWWGREPGLHVTSGEAYGVSSGPLGYRLHLVTEEAEAVVTGTSFAVIRNTEATCFCLYRGSLVVESRREGRLVFHEESRVFIYRDGRPHLIEPITPREIMKLQMIEDSLPRRAGSGSVPDR